MSASDPRIPPALATALFWLLVVACAVAQGYIVRGLFRADPAAGRAGSAVPQSDVPHQNRWMELTWGILPIVGLIAVFVGAWRLMAR
jgi:hypothetical protein